jgi:hypothetical protein
MTISIKFGGTLFSDSFDDRDEKKTKLDERVFELTRLAVGIAFFRS